MNNEAPLHEDWMDSIVAVDDDGAPIFDVQDDYRTRENLSRIFAETAQDPLTAGR
jgi:hypothetical protein